MYQEECVSVPALSEVEGSRGMILGDTSYIEHKMCSIILEILQGQSAVFRLTGIFLLR